MGNGEEVCEGHGYSQNQCENIAYGICCYYYSRKKECLSKIGRKICPSKKSKEKTNEKNEKSKHNTSRKSKPSKSPNSRKSNTSTKSPTSRKFKTSTKSPAKRLTKKKNGKSCLKKCKVVHP